MYYDGCSTKNTRTRSFQPAHEFHSRHPPTGLRSDGIQTISTGYYRAGDRRGRCLCVDANGYAGTHNKRFSQPLTGDYEHDLLHSRDKRIFDDPTGIRCARNTNPFLLQTYARDTGEVLSDLALPIYVDDRHWGNVRLGFNPQVLLDEDKE